MLCRIPNICIFTIGVRHHKEKYVGLLGLRKTFLEVHRGKHRDNFTTFTRRLTEQLCLILFSFFLINFKYGSLLLPLTSADMDSQYLRDCKLLDIISHISFPTVIAVCSFFIYYFYLFATMGPRTHAPSHTHVPCKLSSSLGTDELTPYALNRGDLIKRG